jgi:hypothetical protein
MSGAWGLSLAGWLNRHLPRAEFRAETNTHFGSHVEADVAEWRDDDAPPSGARNGTVATLVEVPPAVLTIPASFPDDIEVHIREEEDRTLVGVIELVSPANKKERSEREAFVAKCVTYLKRGIGLVIIDVVTDRHANLHNELLGVLWETDPQLMADAPTYVSGYRPVHRRTSSANEIEIWPYPVTVGRPVPTVPFGLRGGPVVMLDLDGTYTAAIEATGL